MANPPGAPAAVREKWGSGQAIAVSRGVDDGGLFVLDFRDERYLPFENTGVVSRWTLALPRETNRFDLSTIADVIVTLRYTATDAGAGSAFTKAVKGALASYPYPGSLYLDLARAYPQCWRAFMADRSQPKKQVLSFPLDVAALGAFKSAPTLNEVDLRLDTVGASVTDQKFITLAVGQASVTQPFVDGVVAFPQLAQPLANSPTTITLTFDLAVMRADQTLKTLLGNDQYLDAAKLRGVAAILAYTGPVF
jgi:hypothetical protein